MDSQSAKTTGVEVERDYDVAKRLKGRKRHLLVDTEGLVLRTKVHLASVMDHERIEPLMEPIREHFRRLPNLWTPATKARAKVRPGWRRS